MVYFSHYNSWIFAIHIGGKGCLLDCSMTEGLAYLGTFISMYRDQTWMWDDEYGIFTGKYPMYRSKSFFIEQMTSNIPNFVLEHMNRRTANGWRLGHWNQNFAMNF
jgi:hypothetical protein